jgi:hypothetical protein
MLESVSENKLCLIGYFDKIIKNNNSKRDEELKEMLLNKNEWALIHSLITPLDSIDAVYKLMSGEKYCTISYVFPTIMQFLNEHLIRQESDSQELNDFKVKFREQIEYCFTPNDEIIAKSPAIIASILNPRFKDLSFMDKKIKKLAYNEIKEQMKSFQRTQQNDSQNDNSFEELSYEPQASNSKINPKLAAIEKIFGKVNDSPKEISITNEFKLYINFSYSHNCDLLYW